MTGATHTYIAIWDGTVQAMRVDTADRDCAKSVSKWIRQGASIERVTSDVAKRAFLGPWPLVDSEVGR